MLALELGPLLVSFHIRVLHHFTHIPLRFLVLGVGLAACMYLGWFHPRIPTSQLPLGLSLASLALPFHPDRVCLSWFPTNYGYLGGYLVIPHALRHRRSPANYVVLAQFGIT